MDRRKNFYTIIGALIIAVIIMTVTNTAITSYSNRRLNHINEQKHKIWQIRQNLEYIEISLLRGTDVGVRGYAITKEEKMLPPYQDAKPLFNVIFSSLYDLTPEFNVPSSTIYELEKTIGGYMKFMDSVKLMVDKDQMEEVRKAITEDRGLAVWKVFQVHRSDIISRLNHTNQALTKRIKLSNSVTLFLQLITLLTIIPLLYFLYKKIQANEYEKEQHIAKIEESNAKLENYANVLAHTIRAPICTLNGLIMLLDRAEDDEERTLIISKIKALNEKLELITQATQVERYAPVEKEEINVLT